MLQFIPLLLQGAIDIGKGALSRRQERKQRQEDSAQRIEEARTTATIKRIEAGDEAAISMDLASVGNRGWKDDYLLILTTAPLVLCFLPYYVPYVQAGFTALKETPEWYMWLLAGVYIDTFGFRRILRSAIEGWVKKTFSN